ncbi:MAG: hypothetical protein MRY59_04285 [Aquisalinus sp.]|nr:hypothetical protein [Aquisalinus sp.]
MENTKFSALQQLAASPSKGRAINEAEKKSWFQALAHAWGVNLDRQAGRVVELSEQISVDGQDQPSQIAQLTAESQKFSFMSQSQQTSTNSVAQGLQTIARRQ